MKKIVYSLVLLFLSYQLVNCQITLTLQPDATAGKDALLHGHPLSVDTNMGTATQFVAAAFSAYGSDFIARSIIDFNLSSIPANSTIESATLTLFAIDPATGNVGMGFHSGQNQCWIERVTSAWDENTVTWNTAPSSTDVDRVGTSILANTTDSLVADIKTLVQDIIDNRNTSFGLMIKLQTEEKYRLVNFASSDNENATIRPKLVVTYKPAGLILQPNGTDGKDAILHGHPQSVNTNYGTATQFPAAAASAYGSDFTARSVIEFDLSSIPSNVVIESAKLTLIAIDKETGNVGMGFNQGENQCWIERVTSAWDENTVTWNTQPATTDVNRVATPVLASTDTFLIADVKPLIQDMLGNSNFGFMIKLQTEVKYRLVNFCTSDHAEEARRPKLEVNYSTLTSIPVTIGINNCKIFPNPSNGVFQVKLNSNDNSIIYIYSITGKLIKTIHAESKNTENIDLTNYAKGLYLLKVTSGNQISTEKVRIQ